MILSEALELFRQWSFTKYKPRTSEVYCYHVTRFIARSGDLDLTKTSLEDVVNYFLYLQQKRYKSSTIAYSMIALRQFFRFFFLQKTIVWDYQLIPIPKYTSKPFRAASISEMDTLVESIDVTDFKTLRDKTMLSFLCASGVRVSELVDLIVDDMHTQEHYAVILSKKNDQRRMIFWDEKTSKLLDSYIEQRKNIARTNFVFISLDAKNRGGHLTTRSIQRLVQEQRGDMPVSCHTLRHGLGMRAVQVNVHPRHIQTILGHKNINSSQIYMDFYDTDVVDAYKKIETFTGEELQNQRGKVYPVNTICPSKSLNNDSVIKQPARSVVGAMLSMKV